MKRNRNARKELLDLYLYLDVNYNSFRKNIFSKEQLNHYEEIKNQFDKKFDGRLFNNPSDWTEYYGVFKLDNGHYGIDPKRLEKTMGHSCCTNKAWQIMNKRNTTYFHPKKKGYLDYFVNNFVSTIRDIKNEFKDIYIPILKKAMDDVNKKRKTYTPGDVDLFMQGIYEYDEACMSAQMATWRLHAALDNELYETYVTLLSQFYHSMASRIEAVSVLMYSSMNPKMKKWSRDKLYDNINTKGKSSRDLPSFEYHDKLYLIWNFIKHNNNDTYDNLKKDYPDLLIEDKYIPGKQAKYYVKLSDKLIIQLLDGVEKYFIEWCELNCDEDYSEAQWNYEDYFTEIVHDNIDMLRNPLGLEF